MKEASALDKEPSEAEGLSFPSSLPQHRSQRNTWSQCLRNTPTHRPPQTSAPQKRRPKNAPSPRAGAVPAVRQPRPGCLPLGGH